MALSNLFTNMPVGQPTAVGTVPGSAVPAAQTQGLWGTLTASSAPAMSLTGAQTVQGNLDAFSSPSSQLIQQARQQGAQYAQQRGGINSSIAAGAAERSALEQAGALGAQATAIDQQREAVTLENWANTQNFNRAMTGQFKQGAFQNSLNMLEMLQRASVEDPELFTADIVSGMGNFFSMNANDILKRYFG